ncbi:MAG: ABC transporter permease [Planctomycetota bacterium]|jgi:putative ABC transport system permease protein
MAYIWRNLLQRKVRTALSMLGVAASIAGVVALISVSDGMRQSIDDHMEETGASLTVIHRDAADLMFSRVPATALASIAALDGVEEVCGGNAYLLQRPDLGEGRKKPPIQVLFGRVPGERLMTRLDPYMTSGTLPAESDQAVIGSIVAARTGLKVGDRIPIFRRPLLGIEAYEVVGIFDSETGWENAGIVVDARVLQEQLGTKDSYHIGYVYTSPDAAPRIAKQIEEKYPELTAVPPKKLTSQFDEAFALLEEFIGMVTAIALVIGVLGVLNTMMMSVAERTREIGMLRALGWSRSLIAKYILIEGLLLSILGGLCGLFFGVLGSEILVRFYQDGSLEAVYRQETFLKGMAVAVLVGVTAALYPAWRAANLRPVEALRYE